MKIKRKLPLILTVIAVYLFLFYSAFSTSGNLLGAPLGSWISIIIVIVYCVGTMRLAGWLYKKDASKVFSEKLEFDREFPFSHFGSDVATFLHVFSHKTDILEKMSERIGAGLKENLLIADLSPVSVVDKDKELPKEDKRSFYRGASEPTLRETTLTLILYTEMIGRVQVVKWWVLCHGYEDWNAYFKFIASAPLALPIWITPYLRKRFHPSTNIRTIHPGFYGGLDLSNRVRCIHNNVFDTLVSVLDENGIDTSDLKMQRASVMNVNVSGGNLSMGTVIQGALNKVLTKAPAHANKH